MKKVYKYELDFEQKNKTTVFIPTDSKILKIGLQGDDLFLWALVDTLNEKVEEIKIEIYGTGWEIENAEQLEHLMTYHQNGHVWHVFKRNE